jgi:transcriptional regulator with XRE-family HTH domain
MEMGISRSGYIKLERGDRKLNEASIANAARAFGVDPSIVIETPQEVSIVGLVGAGSNGGVSYAASDGELGWALRPPDSGDKTVAVEVRGTSMRGVAEDGWLIYYDDERGPVTEDMVGELCVLWLADGQVVIKKPFHSRAAGLFDLESATADTMREQQVESAAFVTWIAPRRTVRKVSKRIS